MNNHTHYLASTASGWARLPDIYDAIIDAAKRTGLVSNDSPFEFYVYACGDSARIDGPWGNLRWDKDEEPPVLVRRGKIVREENPGGALWEDMSTQEQTDKYGFDGYGDPNLPSYYRWRITEIEELEEEVPPITI